MKKLLGFFVALLWLGVANAQVQVQWGQDASGTTRNVYVLDPTNAAWLPTGVIYTSTHVFSPITGPFTNGHCVALNSNGQLVDAGGVCTTGGGGGTVSPGTVTQVAYYNATGSAIVGTSLMTVQSGYLLVDNGVAGTPTPANGALLQLQNVSATPTRIELDANANS